jgi:hypothetical protein
LGKSRAGECVLTALFGIAGNFSLPKRNAFPLRPKLQRFQSSFLFVNTAIVHRNKSLQRNPETEPFVHAREEANPQ